MSRLYEKAACKGKPFSWFFAPSDASNWAPPDEAIALCADCPVRVECALVGARSEGLWGGRYRTHRKAHKLSTEVRCDRCGLVFVRELGTKDGRCDSCLSPQGLATRKARDARRRQRNRVSGSTSTDDDCATVNA